MKTCSQCKTTKSKDKFFKHKQTKDGLHSWCKTCCNVGNRKSRDKINSTIEGRAKIFLQNARKSAIKRKQVFELEIKDIVDCWNQQSQICAYSGRKMTLEHGKLNTVSIERIDSNIGYTKDNTILVCNAVNRMKSDFKLDSFVSFCRDISQFLKGIA
jgi:hypothetical protein